jgi:7-keto-8-aminopelargonate synthetase-like enzyme
MINTCRSFIYSTAFPPTIAEACLEAIRVVQTDPDRRERLWRNVAFLNDCFSRRGLPVQAETQVVSYPVGQAADAMAMMAYLKQHGFLVVAIRPPTVPEGESRLRVSLTSEHEPDVIERLVELLATYPKSSSPGGPLNDR